MPFGQTIFNLSVGKRFLVDHYRINAPLRQLSRGFRTGTGTTKDNDVMGWMCFHKRTSFSYFVFIL